MARHNDSLLSEFRAHAHLLRISCRVSLKAFFVMMPPRIFVTAWIPRIVFQVVFFVLLARYAGGESLMKFALIGNAVAIAALPAVVIATSFLVAERQEGTLPMLVMASVSILWPLVGQFAVYFLDGLVSSLLIFVIVTPLFQLGITLQQMLAALPIVIATCFSLAGLGLFVSSLVFRSRIDMAFANFTVYALTILAGVNYPLEVLPNAIRHIAEFLPLTHGLLAIRALILDQASAWPGEQVALEALIGIVLWIGGYLLLTRQLDIARKTGRLDLY